ncbi:MAG TPA: hypothetical protein VFN35_11970, partial [Ktedonobacteraceae bacterium]|nr:hypothetical protein [Ktedonobacteraceae bacterium]
MLTKAALEQQRSAFSDTKRALLEKRLRGNVVQDAPPIVIPKRPDLEFTPATFAQQRVWFLEQL